MKMKENIYCDGELQPPVRRGCIIGEMERKNGMRPLFN